MFPITGFIGYAWRLRLAYPSMDALMFFNFLPDLFPKTFDNEPLPMVKPTETGNRHGA